VSRIRQALWPTPFLVEARFKKLVIRHDISGRDRLFDVRNEITDRSWIELYIGVEKELYVLRVKSELVSDVASLARNIS
jgi:hypothetical protein